METFFVALAALCLPCAAADNVTSLLGDFFQTGIPEHARDDGGWEEAAALIMGTTAVEELSEEVMEKFSSLHDRPLDINAASRGRLLSCGLFSTFQADALQEYREETGEILSFTELALVPGFSEEYVRALKHFIVLESRRAPGMKERKGLDQTLTLRSAMRDSDGSRDWSAGLKYAARLGERAELMWSTRTTYDDGSLKLGTTSAAFYGKRSPGKIVLGNFNARFGQGLAQWSGFSLSGFPTVAAFRKNGTGLSPTGSFVADMKGIGADWTWGHATFSTAASLSRSNIASINNVTWTGKKYSIGASCIVAPVKKMTTASIDWHAGFNQLSLFGEAALKFDGSAAVPEASKAGTVSGAALAGAIWTPAYGRKLAFQGRYMAPSYGKGWSGAALGFGNQWMSATADAARDLAREISQYKTVIQFKPSFALDSLTSVKPSARVNIRWKPGDDNPLRAELRGDISLARGPWLIGGRYDALWCDGFAWLWYAEAGRVKEGRKRKSSLYARFSLFKVDNWDDRIYVYERDAPGSFNVPAYYGRGYALSLVGSVRKRRHTLYLRAAHTAYPWNVTAKPSRFEVKLQYVLLL